MIRTTLFLLLPAALLLAQGKAPQRLPGVAPPGPSAITTGATYFPGKWDDWQRKRPEEAGLDAARVEQAVVFAKQSETPDERDQERRLRISMAREPYNDLIGPTKERGGQNGIILRHGYIVAEWGETDRADMTYSVTKSYVSTTAGLAFDRGLIRDVHDRVRSYVHDGGFDSPHNSQITWHMLLNQTSEWEGTLWGKPDWADRWNGKMRVLAKPGTHWQYNDVRVNRLALALLEVWRRPLPQVLKELVMDPIDASPTWRWHGYNNSWVTIDGAQMQSVSGGGHWGGGLWISTRDHARFGYLYSRRGKWGDRQLLSEDWARRAFTPTPQNPTYGYMNFFPNTGRKLFPSAPASSIFLMGNGTNTIWIDPEHDLVAVLRWIDRPAIDGFVQRLLAAVKNPSSTPGSSATAARP